MPPVRTRKDVDAEACWATVPPFTMPLAAIRGAPFNPDGELLVRYTLDGRDRAWISAMLRARPTLQSKLTHSAFETIVTAFEIGGCARDASPRHLDGILPDEQMLAAMGEKATSDLVKTVGTYWREKRSALGGAALIPDLRGWLPERDVPHPDVPFVSRETENVEVLARVPPPQPRPEETVPTPEAVEAHLDHLHSDALVLLEAMHHRECLKRRQAEALLHELRVARLVALEPAHADPLAAGAATLERELTRGEAVSCLSRCEAAVVVKTEDADASITTKKLEETFES